MELIRPSIATAILELAPDSRVSVPNDINKIKWHDSNPKGITVEQIQIKYDEQMVAYDAQEYARNRAPLYPAIGDQLDLLWHAIDTGDWTAAKVKTTDFYTKLKKVKDDNPKPS